MKKSYVFSMCMILFLALILTACATKVERENPDTAKEVTASWDIKDINIIARKMIASLREHRLAKQNPPAVILVLRVRNKTYEHIDTKAITDTVITALVKDQSFRVIAEREMRIPIHEEKIYKETVESSDDEELFPLDIIRKHKNAIGADYVMYGEIVGIEKRLEGVRDVSYKMTLKLVDIDTTLIEWQEQKDIRKKQERTLFGW